MFISSAITFRKSLSQGKVVEDTPEASVPLASLRGAVPYRLSFTAVISPQLPRGTSILLGRLQPAGGAWAKQGASRGGQGGVEKGASQFS